jgi:hypothetical protein
MKTFAVISAPTSCAVSEILVKIAERFESKELMLKKVVLLRPCN